MTDGFKNVTFISLLKDNKDDSELLIKYIKQSKLFLNHLIADGSKKNQKKIFEDLSNPKLSYYYFGYDRSYFDLYIKIQKSLKKVKTKYVYFLDQGDYVNFKEISKSIKFLDKNKNYSCSLGDVFNFKFFKNQMIIISKLYKKKIIYKKKLLDRLTKNFHFRSYHALHKTKILKKSISMIVKLKIKEPRTAEFIIDSNNLINGNIHTFNNTLLLHNASKNISGKSTLNNMHKTRKIWYEIFLKKNFKTILKKLLKLNNLKINEQDIAKIHSLFLKNSIFVNEKQSNIIFKRIKDRINLLVSRDNNLKIFLRSLNEKL